MFCSRREALGYGAQEQQLVQLEDVVISVSYIHYLS